MNALLLFFLIISKRNIYVIKNLPKKVMSDSEISHSHVLRHKFRFQAACSKILHGCYFFIDVQMHFSVLMSGTKIEVIDFPMFHMFMSNLTKLSRNLPLMSGNESESMIFFVIGSRFWRR